MTSKQGTVLVVEDNDITRKFVRLVLEGAGYTVGQAISGADALERVANMVPDVILLDIMLPDTTGIDLVPKIRGLMPAVRTPIIAFTGHLARAEDHGIMESAFDGILVKPVDSAKLLEVVRSYLGSSREEPATRPGGIHVLVADDNAIQLKFARLALSRMGVRVSTAANGQEALERVRSEHPDVVLSDILMPEMDGFDLCQAIRQDPEFSGTPVVLATSNYTDSEDVSFGMAVGADAVVTRSTDQAEAIEHVMKAAAGARTRRGTMPTVMYALHHEQRVARQVERLSTVNSSLLTRNCVQQLTISTIIELSESLVEHTNTAVRLDLLLRTTLDMCGVLKGALYQWRADGVVRLVASHGFASEETAKLESLSGRLLRRAVDEGQILTLPSDRVPPVVAEMLGKHLGINSMTLVPTTFDGRVTGVLVLASSMNEAIAEEWLDFARSVGQQIGIATGIQQMVSRLETTNRRHRTLMDNASDAFFIARQDGTILEANHKASELCSSEPDDLIGRNIATLVVPEDAAHVREMLSALQSSRHARLAEVGFPGPDSGSVVAELAIAKIDLAPGQQLFISARDVTERKMAEEHRERLSSTDALTGLVNRRRFRTSVEQSVQRGVRLNSPGAVVFIDLDGFRFVNEAYGLPTGDNMLIAAAHALRECVGVEDVVARVGGDEFAVILNDVAVETARARAGEVVRRVGETVGTTASAGIAMFSEPESNTEDPLVCAEIALDKAKEGGPNHVHLYDPAADGLELLGDLERVRRMILDALKNDRFVIVQQRLVNTCTGKTAAHEVLVRLRDADGQLLAPASFIPQAETLGLIRMIDQRVFSLAFDQWRRMADGGQKVKLSINLSARCVDREMAEYITEAARSRRIDKGYVVVEITESATSRATPSVAEAFTKLLTGAGIELAVDDFGGGHASFNQIRNLRPRWLKLDGTFIEDLRTQPETRELCKGLAQVAHTMRMQVVAEFVQDQETLDILCECGIEYAQGYFLGKPEPFPESSGVAPSGGMAA